MEDVLIDWAAGTQHCKYLFKHLYLINSSLFIKLSDGKPIWHLVPNLYGKAPSLAGGQFKSLLEGKIYMGANVISDFCSRWVGFLHRYFLAGYIPHSAICYTPGVVSQKVLRFNSLVF